MILSQRFSNVNICRVGKVYLESWNCTFGEIFLNVERKALYIFHSNVFPHTYSNRPHAEVTAAERIEASVLHSGGHVLKLQLIYSSVKLLEKKLLYLQY